MTITESYRKMNEQLHADHPAFGAYGYKQGPYVLTIIKKYSAASVLDYGAGKGSLKDWLRRHSAVQVQNYDPAVPEFAAAPAPADLVVCSDVLEHVEPDCVAGVLAEIAVNTRKVAYFNIATRKAQKTLPDGRNAHVSIMPPTDWFSVLSQLFDIVCYEVIPGHSVTIVGTPRSDLHE
jgi:2-polyprenyl-3-methyl-5-hydroxy-6-metoxy-1,4-benzoquinol methylase